MAKNHEPGTITLEDGRFKLTFQPEQFWQSITTALVSYLDGDKGSMAKSLTEGLGSFSQTNTNEHKTFRLIYTALRKACVAILTEGPDQERLMEKVAEAGLRRTVFSHALSQKLGSGKYTVDSSFFAEPRQTGFLRDAQDDYRDYLREDIGLETRHADALAAVLPYRFVRELALEWEQADYSALREHFNNPFLEPLKKAAEREKRHANLLQRFAKPAFNDPRVTLAEMYIEPDFWVHGSCIPEEIKNGGANFQKVDNKQGRHDFYRHRQFQSLHPFFLKWVGQEACFSLPGEKDSILILLGQPGQGKSSAFLRVVDQLLREHPGIVENVFLVRLRDIEHPQRLVEDPLPEIRKRLGLEQENQLKDSLLLLDGLDELYMSQGLTLSQIHEFVRMLRKQLKQNAALSIRVALSSRTNYLKLDDLAAEDYLVLHLADLSLEQQQAWLKRYRRHYPDCNIWPTDLEKIAKMENPSYNKIRELINQPILLQMIAVSGMSLNEKANTARIYQLLFDRLIKRDWSPEDGQLDRFKKLTEQDLRRFLQTLALHIFQKPTNHEYARRADFEQEGPLKDATERLARKLGLSQLPVNDLLKDLLVSFYFQEVRRDKEEKRRGDDNDVYAYEFLHKSLQEYLVAEKIWDTCRTKFLEEEDGDYRIRKTKEAYAVIAPLFERKVLTQEVADYLHEIVANDTETEKAALKERLKQLFPGLLRANFLVEHTHEDSTPAPLDKMIGNFYGFWTVASALINFHFVSPTDRQAFNAIIENENFIPGGEKDIATHFLVLLQKSRTLKIIHQNLSGVDLSFADLSFADLSGVNFERANLNRAYLFGTHLLLSSLNRAFLSGAVLCSADHSYADFSYANLEGADLGDANLSGANFNESILWKEVERAANFQNAHMNEVIGLETAIGLEKANFKGTIYEGKFSGG